MEKQKAEKPRLLFSCDDGCKSDLRLADLLNRYAIPCTFYWPFDWHSMAYTKGWTPLSLADAKSILSNSLFSLGSHTITHRYLTDISIEEAEVEIRHSKEMLESLFKVPISSFCFPRGRTNTEIDGIVQRNYLHWRPTKGKDSDGRKLVHIHPDSGANDNKPWREVMDKALDNGQLVHAWLHSWEIDRYGLWAELEDFLSEYSHC